MTLEDEIIIACTAGVEALFEPLRDPMSNFWPAAWYLRWNYQRRGLPWKAGGSKDHERALTKLVKGKLIRRVRGGRKTVAVIVTPEGMRRAWSLVGRHPRTPEIVLREVADQGPPGQWIPEIAFNKGQGWGDGTDTGNLRKVQEFHAPAMCLGWIESDCDMSGRVGYRITLGGKEVLEGLEPEPDGPIILPDPEPGAIEIEARSYREMIAWLDNQDAVSVGARGEIGSCGLATAAWAPWFDSQGSRKCRKTHRRAK